MRVAVIGSGNVAQALASGMAARGHETRLLSRDPESETVRAWVSAAGENAGASSHGDGAAWCELAVLATSWTGTQAAIELCGSANLAGKVLVDVTNPLKDGGLAIGFDDSAGETVQRWLPEAKVVKAWNILNFNDMIEPRYASGAPTMFIAGNDEGAKATVTGLLHSTGWTDVVDLGGIEGARLTEALAMVWIAAGRQLGTWRHAFSLLRPTD